MKLNSVLNVIKEHYPNSSIVLSHSVRTAIDALSKQNFDLIVADMSLPTYDIGIHERGGTPRPFGGIEVFEHLECMESNIPVLVVTSYPVLSDGKRSISFDDLKIQLQQDFPKNFLGIVYFDSTYPDWERSIREYLSKRLG